MVHVAHFFGKIARKVSQKQKSKTSPGADFAFC
jgi:hypothetical protein